jgi:hypothetical protein
VDDPIALEQVLEDVDETGPVLMTGSPRTPTVVSCTDAIAVEVAGACSS